MPANFVKTPDGEKAWKKAKGIVSKEYGAGLEKSDPDRFYSLVTTIYKNVCKSPDYDCGIGKSEDVASGKLLQQLSEKIAQFVSIGNPKARQLAVYDLASKVRNFAGDMAMKLADKGDPYGEMASLHPKVKSTGKKMIDAMGAFSKAVFDTEKAIDISPRVRGRLREEIECPVCGGEVESRCRCRGPHTLEQLRKGHGYKCGNGHRWSGDLVIESETGELLTEKSQPKLNKYDPGSLLGWTVHLLQKEGLGDVADEVREVSRKVSQAWQKRER